MEHYKSPIFSVWLRQFFKNFEGEGLAIILFSCMKNYQSLLVYIIYYEVMYYNSK